MYFDSSLLQVCSNLFLDLLITSSMVNYTDGLTAADTDSKEEIFRQFQIAKERLDTISKGPSKGVTVIP